MNKHAFKSTIPGKDGNLNIISLEKVAEKYPSVNKLPFSIRILLENALRNYAPLLVTDGPIESLKHGGI